MGSEIEINDTLKLKKELGVFDDVKVGEVVSFSILGRRLYHLDPVRIFLVEDIAGKWNFIGHGLVQELHIDATRDTTSGRVLIRSLYPQDQRPNINAMESPPGKAYQGP